MTEDWKEHDEYIMTKMAYMSRRISNLIIVSYMTGVIFYATGTVLRRKSDNQTNDRELIVKMDLPFEIENTSVYIVILVIQFVHQISAASIVGVLDCLFITLVSPSIYLFHYLPM